MAFTKSELSEIFQLPIQETLDIFSPISKEIRLKSFGNSIYLRALLEVSNYCKNDCYYCGIRSGNSAVTRYRIGEQEIYSAVNHAVDLGFSTVVMQGGEDPTFTDSFLVRVIDNIKNRYPDLIITLSLGERSLESYTALRNAGANRYLLRHESIVSEHFQKLHPKNQTIHSRKKALYDLKKVGFQTGAGFMVGSPYQTADNLVEEILFLQDFAPEMVGIGPFLPQKDSIFSTFSPGNAKLTLLLLLLARIALPKALIPATTALATLDQSVRDEALILASNVIMPNVTTSGYREKYTLYDNKKISGSEDAHMLSDLKRSMEHLGLSVNMAAGNHPDF